MKFLLADNHALFIKGLSMTVSGIFPACKIDSHTCWQAVHQSLHHQQFDMALLDPFMPRTSTWRDELSKLLNNALTTNVCLIAESIETADIQAAFDLGVKGYLSKTAQLDEVKQALLQIQTGKIYLPPQLLDGTLPQHSPQTSELITARQQIVLTLVAQGKSNKVIARKLNLTEGTVKRHVYNICKVFKANNRVQAVALAREQGLLFQ